MPIKDLEKRREYQREIMRKKRQGLTENVSPVSPLLDRVNSVSPSVSPANKVLDPAPVVSPVRPEPRMLDPVRPVVVSPCPRNHYSLSELFRQATEQVKSAWIEIRSQNGAEQCYNCHNSQRNHQLALNLLEQFWVKSKRLERGEKSM